MGWGVTWSTCHWFSVVFLLLLVESHPGTQKKDDTLDFLSHIQALILALQAQGPGMAFPGSWQISRPSIMANLLPCTHIPDWGCPCGCDSGASFLRRRPWWNSLLASRPTKSSLCGWCLWPCPGIVSWREKAAFGPWLLGGFPNTSFKTDGNTFLPLQTRTLCQDKDWGWGFNANEAFGVSFFPPVIWGGPWHYDKSTHCPLGLLSLWWMWSRGTQRFPQKHIPILWL